MAIDTHDMSTGRCQFCDNLTDKKVKKQCSSCSKPIANYRGQGRVGFDSPAAHHNHFNLADGKASTFPVTSELCGDCYLAAYAVEYPDKALPTLPKISLDE